MDLLDPSPRPAALAIWCSGRTTRSFCPGEAISLLTGERWVRPQSQPDVLSGWSYRRGTGCDTMNASVHLLLFRSGTAGYFDLEHESGTGFFGGFRCHGPNRRTRRVCRDGAGIRRYRSAPGGGVCACEVMPGQTRF